MKKSKDKSIKIAIIGIAITAVVGIGVGLFTYFTTRSKEPIIKISYIEKTELVNIPVRYRYEDAFVNNLWKVIYKIENTGNADITQEKIIGEGIPLKYYKVKKILDLSITKNEVEASLKDSCIIITQWKPNECIELTGYIESDSVPRIDIGRGVSNITIINKEREKNKSSTIIPVTDKAKMKSTLYLIFLCIFVVAFLVAIYIIINMKIKKSKKRLLW